ncbi:unnamed protein product [Bursaphelenchus okinawaensis]|uniref:Uncharacterized protein n=1 Tax=Bursaphelenchus okinawaensis TaxID=465554 RepID=A0A811KAB4_9BILA|nr:unnamed protein product [Bursaphelenchus okinawaensis]CAG9097237.1 unnamed protein product [Bursaphelenchus okinawaensis]
MGYYKVKAGTAMTKDLVKKLNVGDIVEVIYRKEDGTSQLHKQHVVYHFARIDDKGGLADLFCGSGDYIIRMDSLANFRGSSENKVTVVNNDHDKDCAPLPKNGFFFAAG